MDSGCERCAALLAEARQLEDLLTELPLEPPSAAVVRHARGLGRRRPGDGLLARIARLVAPPPTSMTPAFRGGATSRGPALYRAEGYDVDLMHFDTGALSGQVLPSTERSTTLAAGEVYLYGDTPVPSTTIEEGGEFRFESVPAGTYTLVIDGGDDARIVIHDLELSGD